jgi:hypothetical protein
MTTGGRWRIRRVGIHWKAWRGGTLAITSSSWETVMWYVTRDPVYLPGPPPWAGESWLQLHKRGQRRTG